MDDDDFWRRTEKILSHVPHEGNRAVLRRYVKERLANGIKPSTLGNDATAIRGFLVHIGDRPVEEATRDDVSGYVTHAYVVRRWSSKDKRGRETFSTCGASRPPAPPSC